MPIAINTARSLPPDQRPLEIVERKGLGHPDSICDALAEQFSRSLCRYYHENFGLILHHNVDKVLLCAGQSAPKFGGGQVIKPIEIYFAGRATEEFKGKRIPVEQLATDGAREWFSDHLHALDPERHIRVHCLTRPASADLTDLYCRRQKEGVWLANDSSCGVGFAPFSRLESIVYSVETRLNEEGFKVDHPEIGEDIKVLGVRRGDRLDLTIACALIDRFVGDLEEAAQKKQCLADAALAIAHEMTEADVHIAVNVADDITRGSIYMTVTGTSAEAGDDGEAGRGNRVNGLITPFRPMTIESAAGKNPVTHVGKLYNIAANRIAEAIVNELPEVSGAQCYLASRIGKPIDEPQITIVEVWLKEPASIDGFRAPIEEVVKDHLSIMDSLCEDMLSDQIALDRWPL